MAQETDSRIWAQTQFFLTDAAGDFVTRQGVTSVTRTGPGVYDVVLDSGIDQVEAVLSLCAGIAPKVAIAAVAVVEQLSDTLFRIRAFDSSDPPVAIDVPIGFTVQRVRDTLLP